MAKLVEPAWKKEFVSRIQNETIQTDSDIEDFCEEFGVDERDAFRYLAELQTEHTECKGCDYIEYFGSGMYPCNACRRGKKDMYKRAEIPRPFVGSTREDGE